MKEQTRTGMEGSNIVREVLSGGGAITPTPPIHPPNLSQDPLSKTTFCLSSHAFLIPFGMGACGGLAASAGSHQPVGKYPRSRILSPNF